MRRKRSVMRRLAKQMAVVAREIRGQLVSVYGEEEADSLAQTICYEQFARTVGGGNGSVAIMGSEDFISEEIATYVRRLQNLLNEIDVADLVRECKASQSDMSDASVSGFAGSQYTGVMLYFYEEFLRVYDATTRVRRGAYYTPQPVVAYLVKSVDELLRSHFGIRKGLAGDEVQVIDPAVGTGTFLHGVLDVVEANFAGTSEQRGAFIHARVLPRMQGLEVMRAPHAIAHMSMRVRLAQVGVELSADESLPITLANALEKRVANKTVPSQQVLIMLGNPPYSNFGKLNQNEWIDELLDDYKQGLSEKKTNLSDDYIKFIRLAQWQVEQAGRGIVAFVTNNSFLFGLTHRKMRESLLRTFDEIYVLNLHGDRSERYDLADDENVFNITRGVAIVLFVRNGAELNCSDREQKVPTTPVYYQDLIGNREEKYTFLKCNMARTTNWLCLQPKRESYDFVPLAEANEEEYQHFWSLQDVFLLCNSGIQTKKDKLSIHFEEESLHAVLQRLQAGESETLRREMELGEDSSGWRLERAVRDVREHEGSVIDVQYRPFDRRKTYYTGHSNGFLGRPRADVTEHLLRPNLALASLRQIVGVPDQCAVLATKHMLTDRAMNSRNGTPYLFPLYRYDEGGRQHNLNASYLQELERSTGLTFQDDDWKRDVGQFGAEDVFSFLYAVLHTTSYRERYADLLRRDFPRVPAQMGTERFTALVHLGRRLVELHTRDEDTPHVEEDNLPAGDNVVRAIRYEESERRLYFNQRQSFANVSPAVYTYRVGGYQVLVQWLKERRGRALSTRERVYFLHLLSMIEEALEVMDRIDEVLNPLFGVAERRICTEKRVAPVVDHL